MAYPSPINTNYPQGTFVFPSSSTNGRGKTLSETNLRDINGLLSTRNYKVEHSDFNVSVSNANVSIGSGIAVINGYRVVIPDTINLGNPFSSVVLGDEDPDSIKYDINIRLSVQQSTSGFIADETNSQYGEIYIDFDEKVSNQTLLDYINSEYDENTGYYLRDFKPSVQRFNVRVIGQVEKYKGFNDNFKDIIVPIPSDSNHRFTALNWMADRDDALFVNAWGTDYANLSDLTFNASRINGNPTFKLTIGYVTLEKFSGGTQISPTDFQTYDCTKRIDLDELYVGEQSLEEYLASSGGLLKSFGKNIITSVRDNGGINNGSGTLEQIPYVSTLDSAFLKYNPYEEINAFDENINSYYYIDNSNEYVNITITTENDFNTQKSAHTKLYVVSSEDSYDQQYMYVPITYVGEVREETQEFVVSVTVESGTRKNIIPYELGRTYYQKVNDNYTNANISSQTDYDNYDVITNGDLYISEVKIDSGTDIGNLSSMIECSFNSLPTENSSNKNDVVGSQVISVASLNNCYTSYSYNVIKRVFNNISADPANQFVNEKTYANKYYLGFVNPNDYLEPGDDSKIAPPFGLYSDNNLIGFKSTFDGTNTYDNVNILTDEKNIILSSHIVDVDLSLLPQYTKNATYQTGNVVKYGGIAYICIDGTGASAGDSPDQAHWEVVYYNAGNTFEVKNDSATFNVYNNNTLKSSVGFRNESGNASLSLTNGNHTSSMYVNGSRLDSNDKTIIEFTDNINVNGYVRAERVYDAVYNDYAEWYNSSNAENVQEGDIIYYDPDNDEYNNFSVVAKRVVGICTEDYGFILGGEDIERLEDNRKKFIPVSLCGRVKVKVSEDCDFECGDYVYANGGKIGVHTGNSNCIIGKFLKYVDGKNYALVQVQLA